MGLDYSYEIFVPTRNVARALARVAELAPPNRRTPPLTVTLPGGDRVAVPFTSNFRSEPVDCSAGGTLDLDTVLLFGADDVVREYFAGRTVEFDELGRIAVGCIYLTVRFAPTLHPRHASLQFTAATSGMSRMFERSASVRSVFTGLTAAAGGVCCLLDTETDVFEICWLDGREVRDTVPGPRFASHRALVAAWPR
ncbi:hypothetical protein ACFWIQ_13060 [Kitasatospora sp. NPDC127059]|uniref:hypothetical protein n=1 Tax=unclassified Kitasatospora TaxID=2633591 RepID=UPI003649FA08